MRPLNVVMAQGRYPASTVTPLGIDRVGKSLCEKRVMQNRPPLHHSSPRCNSFSRSFFGLKQERIKPPGVLGG